MSNNSLLAKNYKEQEERWDNFIETYYANFEILRWGTNHRVYKNNSRVIKVEWKEGVHPDRKLRLEYEYEILKSIVTYLVAYARTNHLLVLVQTMYS